MRQSCFDTHIGEPERLRRCPICQHMIDRDHEEALALDQPFDEMGFSMLEVSCTAQ